MRNYGQSDRYEIKVNGLNSRLDEIQAAVLFERIKWLEKFTLTRRAIAECYNTKIQNDCIRKLDLPIEPENHVYHLYVILTNYREELIEHLLRDGIQSLIHYPVLANEQEPSLMLKTDPNGLQHARRHAKTCLSIPCHHNLSQSNLNTIVDSINNFRA